MGHHLPCTLLYAHVQYVFVSAHALVLVRAELLEGGPLLNAAAEFRELMHSLNFLVLSREKCSSGAV